MAGFTHPYKKLSLAEFCNKISSNIICTHECKNAENEEKKKLVARVFLNNLTYSVLIGC